MVLVLITECIQNSDNKGDFVAFGKRIVKKEEKKAVINNSGVKNRIAKFSKKVKSSDMNNLGLSEDERLRLFIKNKIINSRFYNGWFITVDSVTFADKMGYNISIDDLSNLVIKTYKELKK